MKTETHTKTTVTVPAPYRIMIATPSYDGKIDSRYVASLVSTLRSVPYHWQIEPRFLNGDCYIGRARDTLLQMAIEADADALVWIDADTYWKPADFVRIAGSPEDYIGGMQRLKTFKPEVPIIRLNDATPNEDGLLEVAGIGFTMLKMSRYCIETLHKYGTPYETQGRTLRQVFESGVIDNGFVGEDFNICNEWRDMGGHIYVDTKVKLGHVSYSTCFDFKDLEDPKEVLNGTH
jgi:hypothetical protein